MTLANPLLLVPVLQRMLAVFFIALVGLGLAHYPFGAFELGVGLIIYALLGFWRPTYLLLWLPLWLTLVNLAPWSGSLYLEDYDFVLAMTLAVLLARGLYVTQIRMGRWQWFFLGLLTLAYSIAFFRGFWPIPEWNPGEISTYYSRWHALRLGKGFFWMLLLLPGLVALLRYDHLRARHDLAWGLAWSGMAIGAVALWERGVLHDVFAGHGYYAVLKNALDFASHYRVTGIFSEMHTGGEAIDGFIALIWPFGAVAALSSRTRWGAALGALCVAGAVYAGVTTFSRVTYVALLVGLIVAAVLWLYAHKNTLVMARYARWDALPGLLPPLLMPYLFMRGGLMTLMLGLLVWATALVAGYWLVRHARPTQRIGIGVFGLSVSVLGIWLMHRALMSSPWIENSDAQAWVLAISASVLGTLGGAWSGWRMGQAISLRGVAMLGVLLVGGIGILTPAAMGSYMEERTATNKEDFGTRLSHWQDALSLMPADWLTHLVGMGTGRFPEAYLWSGKASGMGSYKFVPEQDGYFLQMGGGQDAGLTQRVQLGAFQPYTLSMDVRTADPKVWLRARLYRRNMILLSEWPGENVTVEKHVTDTHGAWQHVSWKFKVGAVGDDGTWGRKPLVLELMNWRKYDYMLRPGTVIDIDHVSLKDAGGREMLANGGFDDGLERWFPHYDFNHLPWHIKNLWVNLYFEMGALGVFAFLGFVATTLAAAVQRARQADMWGIGVAAAMSSYLAVGMFGGLLDMPRIIFIGWLMMLVTALTGPTRTVFAEPRA